MSKYLEQAFTATAVARPGGGLAIRVPFDPADVWGERQRYDVSGTVNGQKIRGKRIAETVATLKAGKRER